MFSINLSRERKFTRAELLFHPAIPPPMHGVNPRTVLGKEWWDKQRFAAYEKNNQCCWACGTHRDDAMYYKHLEAHELYDINWKKHRMTLREIVALCHACHSYVHIGRLRVMVDKRKEQRKKLDKVIAHADRIIQAENPRMWYNYDDSVRGYVQFQNAPKKYWKKWHLLLEGKKYYSKFKGPRDWEEYYTRADSKGRRKKR